MSTDRSSYTSGLRALADALDGNPELPLPYDGNLVPISIGFHSSAINDDNRAELLASAARTLMPGRRDKNVDGSYYRIDGTLHGLKVQVWAMRDQVCERVVTGTRQVSREIPDPAVAVPTVTVTETVEDITWECRPLLAETEAVA